jgi:hypothetical protein
MNTLTTTKTPKGYSWTLTSRLGHMLSEAQEYYGNRDLSYTILGIEFEINGPQTWYPGNCNHIAIQLTPDTATDMIKGCYQLAHECIHLLSPLGARGANTLEEGLATYFAHEYLKKHFNFSMPATIQSYERARNLVSELLTIDHGAIKKLREKEPTISKITAQQITDQYPSLSVETAKALEEKFVR